MVFKRLKTKWLQHETCACDTQVSGGFDVGRTIDLLILYFNGRLCMALKASEV